MSDSEDEQVLLDEQSMDEVHELDDALRVSVDTNASLSPARQRRRLDSDKSSASSDAGLDEDDDSLHSDSSEGRDRLLDSVDDSASNTPGMRATSPSLSGSDSDEPPEIPGSPLKGDAAAPVRRAFPPSSAISATSAAGNVDIFKVEEDEYEEKEKESEQPRAMEFHTSSSSESESEEADGDSPRMNGRPATAKAMYSERPKTAAKELEQYRDAVPEEFFQRIEQDKDSDYELERHTDIINTVGASDSSQQQQRQQERARPKGQTSAFIVHVPAEVQELFSLAEAFIPEEMDIGTRLEPFLPDLMPAVGLPYDGLEIPRPDGREDAVFGVDVVREAEDLSDAVELELLMQVALANDRKARERSEAVRSIDDAAHRPKLIDQWISSVAKAQAIKSLPQVYYKKPMPTLEALMELWPEEFELEMNAHAGAIDRADALSSLSLSLKEMATLVCVLLDIPVHDGLQVQSLHVLFSLYDAIAQYEQQQPARYP